MSISNNNPQPKDVVILQRDNTNTYYGETHISGSGVIIHIDNNGNLTADTSSSFYSQYPPVITVGRSIVLCAAYTPTITGSDAVEITVPFSPIDGNTIIPWNIKRLSIRTQTSETTTSSFDIEKSVGVGEFFPVYVGSVILDSGSYESASIVSVPIDSGDKLRFNVTTLGGATNWTIITELSNG